MKEKDDLVDAARAAVKAARTLGADAAEAYVSQTRTTTFAAQGRFAAPKESSTGGMAIRVLVAGRLGTAGGDAPAATLAQRALDAARGDAGEVTTLVFPGPASLAPVRIDERLVDRDPAPVADLAARAQRSLVEARDVTYASTTLTSYHRRFAVANSAGVECAADAVGERIEIEARVTHGTRERSSRDSWTSPGALEDELDVDLLTSRAIDDARRALDDAPLQGAVDEAIFAPGPFAQLLGTFSTALSGLAAQGGHSPLAGKLGEAVASPLVTLRDEPHGPAGRNHRPFDDEGTPTRPLALIEKGVLRGLLHNAASAAGAGAEPTGHGVRRGLSGLTIQPHNLVLSPGRGTLADLVAGADRAVLVTQPLMGAFVSNKVTGDFSVVAPFAWLVERGEVKHALPPTTVGGNVHAVLREVRAVAADTRAFLPAATPSVRAGGVSCAT